MGQPGAGRYSDAEPSRPLIPEAVAREESTMTDQDPFPFLGTADLGGPDAGLDRWLILEWAESCQSDVGGQPEDVAVSPWVDLYVTVRVRHPRTGEIRTLEFQRFLPSTRGLGG